MTRGACIIDADCNLCVLSVHAVQQPTSALSLECWRIQQSTASTMSYLQVLLEDIRTLIGLGGMHGQSQAREATQAASAYRGFTNMAVLGEMILIVLEKCYSTLADSFCQATPMQLSALKGILSSVRTRRQLVLAHYHLHTNRSTNSSSWGCFDNDRSGGLEIDTNRTWLKCCIS